VPIAGFAQMRIVLSTTNDDPAGACRPFDRDRNGFVFGEAGALLVIETEEHAKARGANILARIMGASVTSDGYHIVAPDPNGEQAGHAITRAVQLAGLTPADMDVACMYDCFTYTVMATMEGFGFCEKGEVGKYFSTGRATYGGDVVVNPHGGLLSEGYIHGLNHHYEAALQLRHAAGVRQVDDAQLALVTAGGGPFGGANVYSREKP